MADFTPIQPGSKTLIRYNTQGSISIPLTAVGGAVNMGQAVRMNGNLGCSPAGAADFPIGTVEVAAAQGKKATVRLNADCTVEGVANGAALAAGAFVRQDGTFAADGSPNYVVAAAGNYACGVVLNGAASGGAITVAHVAPFKV